MTSAACVPSERSIPAAVGPVLSSIVVVAAYNVEKTLPDLLARFPYDQVNEVLVIDDGSTDRTAEVAGAFPVTVIRHPENRGVGAVIKSGLQQAKRRGHDVFVVMAGNGKDDPREICRLLAAISQGYDYVQGSRFAAGGKSENLPLFRRLMVPLSAFAYRVLTGFRGTDAMNGFRAYRMDIIEDPRVDVWQPWLDRYELESYLHYKALTLGYKATEVPVTKSYKHFVKGSRYSHIRPFVDWWSIIRPLVYLSLGLRR